MWFLCRVLFLPLGSGGSCPSLAVGCPGILGLPGFAPQEGSVGWVVPGVAPTPSPKKPGRALLVADPSEHPQPAGAPGTGALCPSWLRLGVPMPCPDNCSVQEIIWRHQIGVWEEIPALPLYIRRGEAVFASVFKPAESLVCLEGGRSPSEDSGAVLEAPGGAEHDAFPARLPQDRPGVPAPGG